MKPGGPRILWEDHVRAADLAGARGLHSSQRDSINLSDGQFLEKQLDEAKRCMDAADVSRGYKALTSDFCMINMREEEAFALLRDKYHYHGQRGGDQYQGHLAEDFEAYGRRMLDEAIARGDLRPEDLEQRLTADAVWLAVNKATSIEGADEGGWRPYALKQMLHPRQMLCNADGQKAILYMLNAIVTGKVPLGARDFVLAWQMTVLQERTTDKLRLINAPFTLARVATAADASISKPLHKAELEPFQVAFGTKGGAENIAHIHDMMEAQADQDSFSLKMDWNKWYYSYRRRAAIDSYAKRGMWLQIQSFVAAFGGRGQGRIVYHVGDGKRVIFPACLDGLPPGHPLSGSACAIPCVDAWNSAIGVVRSDLLREAGSPLPGSPVFNEIVRGFHDNVAGNMFVDDGMMYGKICNDHLVRVMCVFTSINEDQGSGIISPEKTELSMLSGEDVPLHVVIAMSVALASIRDKAAHRNKVERILHDQSTGVLPLPHLHASLILPDFPLATAVRCLSANFTGADFDAKGMGGSRIVGSYHGNARYKSHHAAKKGVAAVIKLNNVAKYPHFQGRMMFMRLCSANVVSHHARLQGADPAFVDGVYGPHDRALQTMVADMMHQPSLDPLDLGLLRLPLRHSGMGIPDVGVDADLPWLGAHLASANFIMMYYPPTHRFACALAGLQATPMLANLQSEYGRRLHSAVDQYGSLFQAANERPHDPIVDGFELSPQGLMAKSTKFQYAARAMATTIAKRAIRPLMSLGQTVGFKAQCAKGAAAMFTALPVKDTPLYVPNYAFTYCLKRRFLKEIAGALNVDDRCHVGSCRERAGFNHFESCVCTPIMERRHEVLRIELQQMFTEVGVRFDMADLRVHTGIRDRLATAGVFNSSGALVQYSGAGRKRGNHEGADMLVHGLDVPGDETAIDVTVVSDRTASRVVPAATPYSGTDAQLAATLKGAEDIKFNRYSNMYSSINVKMMGVAMDLAGGIGPNLRALIKRCEFLSGFEVPLWANWSSGPSFFSAWRQRIIVAVQVKNAECATATQYRSKDANATWAAFGGY